MPNIKSSEKRASISKVRYAKNKAIRTEMKTTIKKFEAAVSEGNQQAAEIAYKIAVKTVDHAASKRLIHKNNAAHKKSALTVKLNCIAQ